MWSHRYLTSLFIFICWVLLLLEILNILGPNNVPYTWSAMDSSFNYSKDLQKQHVDKA